MTGIRQSEHSLFVEFLIFIWSLVWMIVFWGFVGASILAIPLACMKYLGWIS